LPDPDLPENTIVISNEHKLNKTTMRTLLTLLFLCTLLCNAQQKLIGNYIGHNYKTTKNRSFINNQLLFLSGTDTLHLNVKVPFDIKCTEIANFGIYYNCHLKQDSLYTIDLKKICLNDIPQIHNSYYRTNTVFDKEDCSKFIEIEKDTDYEYKGNYGMYVDIENVLYQITGVSPDAECFLH